MENAGNHECRLLADLLPTLVLLAKFFARSDDTAAVQARSENVSNTFHHNIYYEFCRLQAGQIVADDGSLTVQGVGVRPLMKMLESRTSRNPLWPTRLRGNSYTGLEALRSQVREQGLSIEILRQRLRLNTSSPRSRKKILKCLTDCNPEFSPPSDPHEDRANGIYNTNQVQWQLDSISTLSARSHQLLCQYWKCTCLPPGSHIAAKILLSPWQDSIVGHHMHLELLLSTPIKDFPWIEADIWVAVDLTSNTEIIAALSDTHGERWEVESICQHVSQTIGTLFRFLIEGFSIWRFRPVSPKTKNLRNAVHIRLSELIQKKQFLQSISRKDKIALTCILASSILCLFRGPWVNRAWTKDDISFLSEDGNLTTFNLFRPLLSTSIITAYTGDNQAQPSEMHPEPRIATLGIVMLEIALNTTIESQRDDGPMSSNIDLVNANRLLDKMEKDKRFDPMHVLAIKTCLQPGDAFRKKFSKTSQKSLHARIVGPLETIMRSFNTDAVQSVDLMNSGGISSGLGALSSIGGNTTSDSEKWFEDLQRLVFPLISKEPTSKVKIAILDSGIDLPDEIKWAYEDRLTYKSWIDGDGDEATGTADTYGHGTHGAGLLLRVSPHAEIFVARITQKGELDPTIIAEAIKYATDEWKVDIITIPFGFPELEPAIDSAIIHAANNDTIIIAAASNSGIRHSIAWPASSDKVICIHSLDGNGNHSSYTPNPRPQDFGILGEAVSSHWPPHFRAGRFMVRSGTSCAASIAAGVAAIVLEYTQERLPSYVRPESKVDDYLISKLRSNAVIRKTFELMVKERNGHKCIVPWTLLSEKRSEATMCDQILESLRSI